MKAIIFAQLIDLCYLKTFPNLRPFYLKEEKQTETILPSFYLPKLISFRAML